MTATISTHVLDTGDGSPAGGVAVSLFRRRGDEWVGCGAAATDSDGRVRDLLQAPLEAGEYRIVFATGAYFAGRSEPCFYPEVQVHFSVTDAATHHHVPLLLNRFGYATYRGS